MAGMLLNVKVVAVKGFSSLIPQAMALPPLLLGSAESLGLIWFWGEKLQIVQSLDYSFNWPNGPWQLPTCNQGDDGFFSSLHGWLTRGWLNCGSGCGQSCVKWEDNTEISQQWEKSLRQPWALGVRGGGHLHPMEPFAHEESWGRL